MAITGMSRWKKLNIRFWDLRPYTRVVLGREAWLRLTRYIRVNQLEGMGYARDVAKIVLGGPVMVSLADRQGSGLWCVFRRLRWCEVLCAVEVWEAIVNGRRMGVGSI